MDKVKQYDWVSFFDAICKRLHNLSDDTETRERKLLEIAHNTFHADHAILKYDTIDPFSFVYALAQRNTKNQRTEIFNGVKVALDLNESIPTDFTFPTPTPNTPSLFFSKGSYINKSGEWVGNSCLWDFFAQVYSGDHLNPDDFQRALSLKNVGFTKLSQAMFLINPRKYIPFDTQMNSLPIASLSDLKKVVRRIEDDGISVYLEEVETLKKLFIGCELYEVNLLNVLLNSVGNDQLKLSNRYCQVSSWADGQQDSDYFDDFVRENAIWTGGPSGTTGARVYPLQEFGRGDIVLVRRGTKRLGGIGVVVRNGYAPNGYDRDKSIEIVWLAKYETRIEGTALGQWDGFSHASANTVEKFKEAYPDVFLFMDSIRTIQRNTMNHSAEKFKNIILQGPPGTGKTRLALQLAEWLTSDSHKTHSLIEAVDLADIQKEPDVEGNECVRLVQFHPSYSYEDFVRGIKVEVEDGIPRYVVENRILAEVASEAAKPLNTHKPFVLIIDEINRANLTSVLGELIYALEYRGKNVNSMYKFNESYEILLPHNLYIIGTMNTADRSVAHIDYAIRRRFAFVDVLPSVDPIKHSNAIELFKKVEKLFTEIEVGRFKYLAPDFEPKDVQLGHSYFLTKGENDAQHDSHLKMKLTYEILPILNEYVKDGLLLDKAKEYIQKEIADFEKALNGN